MELVRCPICGGALVCERTRWHCETGHSFDVARQGYVNLLPVSQKHSRQPGDSRLQVAARREFLEGGFYAPIARTLTALLEGCAPERILDVGCGEGYYLQALQRAFPGAQCFGVDISKDAVRYAAVRCKGAVCLTATASHLPFFDGGFDVLTSLFALTLPQEFARVLRPGGAFLQVTAGREHLLGLKSLIYPKLTPKAPKTDTALPGFTLEKEEKLEFSLHLSGPEQVMQLLYMTPHAMRIGKEGLLRAQQADHLEDRAQVLFRLYRKRPAPDASEMEKQHD